MSAKAPSAFRSHPSRRTIVGILVVAILVAGSGSAWAAVTLARPSQNSAGQYVSYSGAVPGVTDAAVIDTTVPGTPPSQASTSASSLTSITLGSSSSSQIDNYCVNACTAAHFAEELQYTVAGQSSAEGVQIVVNGVAGSTTVSTTIYLSIPKAQGSSVAATLNLYIDLSASSTTLSATATLQKCSTSTSCP